MSTKVYEYSNCSTCKKALKFLSDKKISFEKIAIVEQPPSIKELKKMLGYLEKEGGSLKNLFNTSGQVYREMGVAEKLKAGMGESEALQLLSQNGKLIKRPFLLTTEGGTVGFKEDTWKKLLR
jgi:arsenate reductase (glutaredoxin)